jgi:hypothetical protein
MHKKICNPHDKPNNKDHHQKKGEGNRKQKMMQMLSLSEDQKSKMKFHP